MAIVINVAFDTDLVVAHANSATRTSVADAGVAAIACQVYW